MLVVCTSQQPALRRTPPDSALPAGLGSVVADHDEVHGVGGEGRYDAVERFHLAPYFLARARVSSPINTWRPSIVRRRGILSARSVIAFLLRITDYRDATETVNPAATSSRSAPAITSP